MLELLILGPDDWALWRRLRLEALAEAPYAFGSTLADWQGDGDREERWRSRLAGSGARNLVAVLDGLPAGMASGVPSDRSDCADLISMWVSPAARGRGVGDALIEAIGQWAVESGFRTLLLSVMAGNDAAIALYRRNGFLDTGRPGDVRPDGVHRELVYAKDLAPPGSPD